uniref:Uncharacterized protein n=1 Tax=Sphaerodactylus townsendi TaxID=933632 RepID=A0ACB8FJM3_9SAUR
MCWSVGISGPYTSGVSGPTANQPLVDYKPLWSFADFHHDPGGKAAMNRAPAQARFLAVHGLLDYKLAGNHWLAPNFDPSTVGSEFITLDRVSGTISKVERSINRHFKETVDLRRFLQFGARPKKQPSKKNQSLVIWWLQEQLHEMQLRVCQAELELETEHIGACQRGWTEVWGDSPPAEVLIFGCRPWPGVQLAATGFLCGPRAS